MSKKSFKKDKFIRIPLSRIILYIFIISFAILFIIPFYWMLIAAISGGGSSFEISFFPKRIDFTYFRKLILDTIFPRWFLNSLIVASVTMFLRLFLCSTAGYAFAKKCFPGDRLFFWMLMSTMMVPGVVNIIPMFLIGVKLNLLNTYAGMIIPVASYPFGIFLMRQFILTIPSSIIDASIIDGCNEVQVFIHAVLPLAKPAIGALGIISFTQVWNSFVWQTVMTNTENMRTLPVGISTMAVGQYTQDWGTMLAGITMAAIPMATIFLIFQDYFVKGLTAGSVKG